MEELENTTPSYEGKWGAMLAVSTGSFMGALDMSIINISLPTMMVKLNANFITVQWIVISYSLIITSVMMGAARMGDMFDKKSLYKWGLLLFTIGSLLCGFSPNVGWMIAFRVLQGFGAVILQALGVAIIVESFPPEERGRSLGILGGISSSAFSLGPAIGGLIIAAGGWRWIFFFNVPIGFIGLWASIKFLPKIPPYQVNQRFDVIGAIVLFITLGCFALGMTIGQNQGFEDMMILTLLLVAAVGIIFFIFLEGKVKFPMVDLSLFKNLVFCVNLLMSLLSFITISGFFLMPFFLQFVKGYTPEEIGFILMVNPVCVGIFSFIAGNLSDRLGTQGLCFTGMLTIAAGCICISTLTAETGVVGYLMRITPLGIGLGTFAAPNNSAVMGASPPERFGVASGLLSLTKSLAQTAGMPIMGTIFTATLLSYTKMEKLPDISRVAPDALVKGLTMTYLSGGLFIIIVVIVSLFLFRYGPGHKQSARHSYL